MRQMSMEQRLTANRNRAFARSFSHKASTLAGRAAYCPQEQQPRQSRRRVWLMIFAVMAATAYLLTALV